MEKTMSLAEETADKAQSLECLPKTQAAAGSS